MRVLIVPDKFKGTLTAGAAAQAIADGWRAARPRDSIRVVPMSDGGDGFGEVMSRLLGARAQTVKTCDAAHRRCTARWWWEPKNKTAIIDSAGVIGLAMLPPGRFHPFDLDTYGLGIVLRSVIAKGARRCLIGLGGSATNDGGFGLARGLGWRFFDRAGNEVSRWTEASRIADLVPAEHKLHLPEMTAAVDVRNPLLGRRGATRIFGPQKGLLPRDFRLAEKSLKKLAALMETQTGRNLADVPGAGAAGGLGFGLMAFCDGTLRPGFDLFASHARLEEQLRWADLVITGEGSIDRSTFMGKGAGGVALLCQKLSKKCIGLAGQTHTRGAKNLFYQMHSLLDVTTDKNARNEARHWLKVLATRTAVDERATRLEVPR